MMKSYRYFSSAFILTTLTYMANAGVIDLLPESAGSRFINEEENASVLSNGNVNLVGNNIGDHSPGPATQKNLNQHFTEGQFMKFSEQEEQELDLVPDKNVRKLDLQIKLPEEIIFSKDTPIDTQKQLTISLKAIVKSFFEAVENNDPEKLSEHLAPNRDLLWYEGVLVSYDSGVLGKIGKQLSDRKFKIGEYHAHSYSRDVNIGRQIILDLTIHNKIKGASETPRFAARFAINHEHKMTMLQVKTKVLGNRSDFWEDVVLNQYRNFRDQNSQ